MQHLRKVPSHILRPAYAATGLVPEAPGVVVLQTKEEIDGLRRAGQIARQALEYACSLVEVGRTTNEIDALVHEEIIAKHGAFPAPLNYRGFPKSMCASVNNQICHGIPDDVPIGDGDIVKFDVSVFTKEGFFGDNCATVLAGNVDESGKKLFNATVEAINAGIAVCAPGRCLSEIGAAIEDVANKHNVSSVKEYCGHGIGRNFHMLPLVQHYRNPMRLTLQPGMVFTIEPMICEGSAQCYILPDDGWTIMTNDGLRAAQLEHTIVITEDGHEVITKGDPSLGF